jgi:DNA-binding SARP family transcriptional activator
MELKVRLFGKLCVQLNSDSLERKMPIKVQELLGYLLIHHQQPQPRESLAEVLWGDQPSGQARRYLSKALWQLQMALPQSNNCNDSVIKAEQDWIKINPQAVFWFDVVAFENAYFPVQKYEGWELDDDQVKDLEKAVEWYQGDLLAGWYQDWCLIERERLKLFYINMLEKLMSRCEATGTFAAGQEYGYRILRYDLAHERTHRKLMRLLYLAGNRTGALRQYRRCCQILKEELGVVPSQRTQALYHQICNDQVTGNQPVQKQSFPLPSSPGSKSLLSQVHALRIVLEEFERRLESRLTGPENS